MLELTSENFEGEISKGWVIVDFWATWCGPCKMLGPVFEEVAKEMKEIKFAKVNVDEQQELASKFQVMSIPTLILFKDGKVVQRKSGAGTKAALKEWIGQNIGQG